VSRNGFLSLLLLGLLGIGLASLTLPEEIDAGPHLYDGDEDDAAIAVPGRTNVYVHHDDFGFPSIPVFPMPETGWLHLDPQFIPVSSSSPLRVGLTRAPPVR
jgi:hypothetical protein